MDVVIDSECLVAPENFIPLTSQGTGLLNFLTALGYDSQNPPIADLLRAHHKLGGNWFVVSPIHWHATHNDALILAVGRELGLDEAEWKHCFQLYADYLTQEGVRLHYHDSDHWLLNEENHLELHAKPVYQLRNKSLMPELQHLDSSMHWQKFITESQMFFATLANNPSINGVWVWGSCSQLKSCNIPICANEHFYELAAICSTNVTRYTPDVSLTDFKIILLNNADILTDAHQNELSKKAVNWFWNNTAYTLNGSNWLTRLWRTLINAH